MPTKRITVVSLLLVPLVVACNESPNSLAPRGPLFSSSGGGAHFIAASASGPSTSGLLNASFTLGGLGSSGSTVVTATADGNAVWACQTSTAGEFDVWPLPEARNGSVSGSNSAGAKNGNVSGTALVPSPAATIQCLNPHHTLTALSASFANVRLSHPTAGVQTIPGSFSQTFFTVATPTGLPTITIVALNNTTLTIGGAPQTYSVTIHNPGGTLPLVAVQAWLRQGTTYRAADGTQVLCTGTSGELPSGDCTFSFVVGAANGAAVGNGDIGAGPATFELQLEVGASQRTVYSYAKPVTLQ